MKLLYATDTHLKGRNPSSRTDDFPRAMLLKLEELCYVAQRLGALAILHGGDLFDVPDVANTLIGEVGTIIRKYGVPFYVVPGNHDLFGYQLKSLPQTALGVLERTGVVKLLTRDGGPEEFNDGTVKVVVQGQEYYADIDKGDPHDYEFPGWIQADQKILIPHSMLVPKEFFPGVPCTLTKDVNTSADLIMVGHYHPGFDDHTIGTTRFVNPGSMGRLDATKSSISRIPEYIIIDAKANQPLTLTFKPFKTAKPGVDVLDNSHLKANAARAVQVGNFQSSVANVRQLAHTDINSILLNLATQQTQPITVVKIAKDAIVAAEQNDKATTATGGFIEMNQHTTIAEVEIENFQSHPFTKMDFAQGMNAIVGQSDSGKTAIMRGIRWVAYNEPKGTDFIRTGANDVRVRITMDNGQWVERGRSRKVAGYYTIGHTEADGTQVMDTKYEGFGNDIPIEIQNILQMPKSNLGRGDAETLNMSYQLNAPFLISEGSATKAAVIGRLTGVHLVDTAISGINTEHLRAKKKLNEDEAKLKQAKEDLQAFADLDTLGSTIAQVEKLINYYETFDKASSDLLKIHSDIAGANHDISLITTELKQYENVGTARQRMDKIDAAFGVYQQLVLVQETIRETDREIADIQSQQTEFANMPMVAKRLEKLEVAAKVHGDLKQIQREVSNAESEIAAIQRELSTMPDTQHLKDLIDDLDVMRLKKQALVATQQEIAVASKEVKELEVATKSATALRLQAQKDLDELLGTLDICPTCARPMEMHIHA